MENWDKIFAVSRMQEFIEENLNKPISLYMLAKIANYSPFHTERIFKELLNKTPFEYIRELRLTKAALKIRDENVKIVDVAFDFVFDSHEGFTRAFSKHFGMTPKYYSKNTPPIKLFLPSRIHSYYQMLSKGETRMSEKIVPVFVQVIERPERKLILKRGINATEYFAYCEEVGCDVWGVLCSIKEALYEPMGLWLPEKLRKIGTSEYCQGVEVPSNYEGIVPDDFDIISLPPCKMMIFQGEPYDDEFFGEEIYKVQQVIKSYNPNVYGFTWADDDAPRFQFEPRGYRGYIEGKPVRELNK